MFLACVTFFYNKGYQRANRYLAGFLFAVSLYMVTMFHVSYGGSIWWVAFFSSGFASSFFLIGPFAYFYVRSILRDSADLRRRDYLHFLPFVIMFLGILPYMFSSWEHKLEFANTLRSNDWKHIQSFRANRVLTTFQNEILRPAQSLFYGFSLWFLLWKYRAKLFVKATKQPRLIRNWLLVFNTLYTFLVVVRILVTIYMLTTPDRAALMPHLNKLSQAGSVLFLLLNVSLYFFPHILYGLPVDYQYSAKKQVEAGLSDAQSESLEVPADNPNTEERYQQLFSEEYLEKIKAILENWANKQKYQEGETSMAQLAIQTGIPAHHLSYYFNNISSEKFTDWRNQLKVDYAKRLIQEGFTKLNTLEALGTQAGFSSKSTFFRAFKKAEGMTPSEYDQLCREK